MVERRIYVSVNKGVIDSDNGLSPVRCQVIILTNAGLMLTGPMGTYLSDIVIKSIFSPENASGMSSAERKPFYLSLNLLITITSRIQATVC